MQGDFSRHTFAPEKHFTRVLMQQGRVQLDANWNEQMAILFHYLRTLAVDLIGSHAGPGDGFKIRPLVDEDSNLVMHDFLIEEGHYYVQGILCENERPRAYTEQPDYVIAEAEKLLSGKTYLVYIDVWERHISSIEDDNIREVALGGPDTATRAQIVWLVKTLGVDSGTTCQAIMDMWSEFVDQWQPPERGQLKARAKLPRSADSADPCITPPDARYRGAENQLYRVEIHTGGTVTEDATFKWSRENGSVSFPIRTLEGRLVTLEHLGRDTRFGLEVGDWVEIVDDDSVLQGRAEPLLRVDAIDRVNSTVMLKGQEDMRFPSSDEESPKHPLLRRWDQTTTIGAELKSGAVPVQEGAWLDLEDGIQIAFSAGGTYRTGDYWLIPARTATGDVEWPGSPGDPQAVPPHGVTHSYAPLAVISLDGTGTVTVEDDCRRAIQQLWK